MTKNFTFLNVCSIVGIDARPSGARDPVHARSKFYMSSILNKVFSTLYSDQYDITILRDGGRAYDLRSLTANLKPNLVIERHTVQ